MRARNILPVLTVALILGLAAAPCSAGASASPFVKVGPQAIPAAAAGPSYGLFTCQVGLSSATCYDPYQMRHAYNIDTLINAGFDGRGRTIVIVDAFQSPNIVGELNFFNSFYGLPGLNGLGGPHDPSLGTFTQVASGRPDAVRSTMPTWLGGRGDHAGRPVGARDRPRRQHRARPGKVQRRCRHPERHEVRRGSQSRRRHLPELRRERELRGSDLLAQQHQVFADATMKHITLFASSGDDGAAQPTCDGIGALSRRSPRPPATRSSPPWAAPSCTRPAIA